MAFEYGSQTDLHPPPKTASRATFKLPGPASEDQVQAIQTRLPNLNGVTAVIWSAPKPLIQVDYDSSVTATKDIALELQAFGVNVEALVWIRVDGMHCQSCVQSIEGQIGELPGVSHIQVSLQEATAVIVFQPLVVTQQELRDNIEDMGFAGTLLAGGDTSDWERDTPSRGPQTTTVWIVGMTCNSCVQSIEGRISEMTGVLSIAVSLKEEKGTITFDPSLTQPEQLRAAIEDMGFDAFLEGTCLCRRFVWSGFSSTFQ